MATPTKIPQSRSQSPEADVSDNCVNFGPQSNQEDLTLSEVEEKFYL